MGFPTVEGCEGDEQVGIYIQNEFDFRKCRPLLELSIVCFDLDSTNVWYNKQMSHPVYRVICETG